MKIAEKPISANPSRRHNIFIRGKRVGTSLNVH
jgi:hypothetical protein